MYALYRYAFTCVLTVSCSQDSGIHIDVLPHIDVPIVLNMIHNQMASGEKQLTGLWCTRRDILSMLTGKVMKHQF